MTNLIEKPSRKALGAWRVMAGCIAVWSLAAAALAQLPQKTISASAKREKGIAALKTATQTQAQAQAMMGAPISLAPHETLETEDHFLRGIRFTGAAGLSLAAPAGDPETAARAFLSQHQYLFTSESGAVGFATQRIRSRAEQSFVLLRQTYAGVPVWGGQIAIQTGGGSGASGVRYAFGHLLRDTTALDSGQLAVKPSCDAAQAKAAAIARMATQYISFYLRAEEPELMIYDPPMLGQPGRRRLVWRTVVTSVLGPYPNEFILVDAHTLEIALHYTLTQTARGREIYDANNTSANPGTLVRTENDPPCSIEDANQAYDYLGDTYDFYNTQHGRDGIDNRGSTISATVRYCDPAAECPFANAFWNGSRIYLGAGMTADDVVAHELTHGVTQNESGLVYAYESGALNESFSDIWGEFVDLTNGKGNDSAAVRWEMGEDLPTSVGVIRDMRDPTRFDQPDRMYSRLWYAGSQDNGGVHINSGVGNKLCYLLTDGGAFNGQTVTGMGIPKVAQLFYECQTHLLMEFSDYEELSFALAQAAINLGLTADEKSNVDRACQAVEIKNPGTLDHYRIIYKDRDNPSLQPELKENKIIISDPRAYGTLSITKIRNAGLYHKISAVQCAGALTKIYTETDIDQIETTGVIHSLTARNAYVKRIAAKEIGSVRISARPALISGSAQWFTSIYSGEDNPKGALDENMAPLKVNLSGVGLTELRAPAQSATIALASKKWRRLGVSDFSSALINYMETNVISAGEIKSLTVRGGSIQPYMIEASAPSSKSSRITASYALFTFSLAGRRFGYLFDGAIYPDYLLSRAARLRATANGGDLFAIGIYCENEITQLTARFKYSSLIKDSWGGGVVADVIRSGYYPTSPSLAGAIASGSSSASGIKSIQADCGVNVFYDSSSGATYALTGDIRAGDGCGASIGKIKTLKPSVKKLPGWVKTIEGPRVYGRGYSADEPKIINGSYDAYFVWFPCGQ